MKIGLTCFMHQGTGTKAGDPAELGALHKTIGQGATKSRKLYVGSVKPNVSIFLKSLTLLGISVSLSCTDWK